MKNLSYKTLEEQGFNGYLLKDAPEKVLQFGEGNFLRAFVDYFIDILNEKAGFNGKVAVVQPIERGLTDLINEQEGLFTLILRGRENGEKINKKRLISSISRCINPYKDYEEFLNTAHNPELRFIVSNTTEAGIAFDDSCSINDAPPKSFPAKLTALLYERYKAGLKGFIILSCELIDNNGAQLKKCVEQYIELWNLEEEFKNFVENENIFCSTLVDRIVTGYPKNEAEEIYNELGYKDNLIDTGEIFGFWVIEGPDSLKNELPFQKAELPVLITDNHTPYKKRKVRILNGAHTSMVLAAFLAGRDIVRDCMEDSDILAFMEKTLYSEIIPTLDLPEKELSDFAAATVERFNNPYIDHALLSISLNSTSKWKARVMPSLTEYISRKGELPPCLTFSFAAYISFYTKDIVMGDGCLIGKRDGNPYEIKDDADVLEFYFAHKDDSPEELAKAVINNTSMWGNALLEIEGFSQAVAKYLHRINEVGMREALKEVL